MKNKNIGVVVIGRNEGERLKICLKSVVGTASKVIYVDSGSTDGSIDNARALGVEIVNLDTSVPFTAARARNEGFSRLCENELNLSYVQFVDGDCEVVEGWLEHASEFLNNNKNVAIVCGRRRERYPQTSIYNALCDIEWDTPIGEAKSCGGDSLMRIDVFKKVSGFNPAVIAGEEPELCVRVRQNNYKIWRLDFEMTRHDANITRFGQWWNRNIRAGYAYSLGAYMHGAAPEFHCIRETKRIRFWGFYLPVIILVLGNFQPEFYILLLSYPAQIIRIKFKNSHNKGNCLSYAFFVTLGKFPEMQGQLRFWLNKILRKRSHIIEYKG